MGIIYRATHITLDLPRAVKLITPQFARDRRYLERFRIEATAAARIEHPNVVAVHDFGEVDGSPYLVMQYVEGVDLERLVAREGPLAPRRALALLAQIADGLDAAHAMGVVHRDVKPGNILVVGERALLTDVGLAKQLTATPGGHSELFGGTLEYAAPEQMERGVLAGPSADWYALGCLLHHALAGQAPFSGAPDRLLELKRAGPPPLSPARFPAMPPELESLRAQMLRPDPSRRPRGEEVLRALEGLASAPPAPPVSARRPSAERPAVKPPVPAHPDEEFRGTQRFEVLRQVGSGGMGVVYAVMDRERGAQVALKTLRQLSPHGLYLFKNEFRALADLRHPNLVNLYELFCDGGLWFFTMELLQGEDLLAHVRAGWPPPRFDEGRLRAALPQLVRGLMALHAAGKIHRDVKPSNVMVTTEGRVVLMDFGLVTDTAAASEESLIGTPHYMAPEQVVAQNVGPPSDWYALGVVLYQLLTGRFPFEGPYSELLESKRTRAPLPPSALSKRVPEDLSRLTADLLRMHPEDRPTGPQLLERLGSTPPTPGPASPAALSREHRFVGRAAELAALKQALDAVRGGAARGVLVHGESGVGKSALVRHFAEELRGIGHRALVLAGRCYEQESVPYKAFDGVVDALSRELLHLDEETARRVLPGDTALVGRLFPVLQRVPAVQSARPARPPPEDPFELRGAAFAALRTLLRHLSALMTPVLFVDDLQWADQDSLALLGELFRPPSPPPFLLLATLRGNLEAVLEAGGALAPLAPATESLEEMQLSALPERDALELARELGLDERRAGELVRESGGHPLYLIELGVGHRAAQAPRRGPPGPGPGLDALLQKRAQALPESARHLLGLVSLAGGPIQQGVLARATGLSLWELSTQVAELRAADLVRTLGLSDASPIEPFHDRVRES
ncbi:MAG TPA: protein kinase, partial [Myxococcales bacterium]|nr:protein kinase [Myxococcales bacterium]